jgi:hypothetical protein
MIFHISKEFKMKAKSTHQQFLLACGLVANFEANAVNSVTLNSIALNTFAAPQTISIGQQSNPSPVPVRLGILGNVPFVYTVKSTDLQLAQALQAKWSVEAHCQTQLDTVTIQHPNLSGTTVKSQAKVEGRKGFPSGSYFKLQSYNINTAKNVCLNIINNGSYPGLSPSEIWAKQDAFNANGGFLVNVMPTVNDKLILNGRCLTDTGTPTLTVLNKNYSSQPIQVACCNADQSGSMVKACTNP